MAQDVCRTTVPAIAQAVAGHAVTCHFWDKDPAELLSHSRITEASFDD
jgi:hypothetical protein